MNTEERKGKRKNLLLYNLIFLLICAGVFLFLWNAPEETTKHLPNADRTLQGRQPGRLCGKKEVSVSCDEYCIMVSWEEDELVQCTRDEEPRNVTPENNKIANIPPPPPLPK